MKFRSPAPIICHLLISVPCHILRWRWPDRKSCLYQKLKTSGILKIEFSIISNGSKLLWELLSIKDWSQRWISTEPKFNKTTHSTIQVSFNHKIMLVLRWFSSVVEIFYWDALHPMTIIYISNFYIISMFMMKVPTTALASHLHDTVDTSWLPYCNFLLSPWNLSPATGK